MRLVHRNTSGPLPTSTYDLVADAGTVLGFTQIRHRPCCNADLPPEAANNIYYEIAEPYRGAGYGKELMRLALKEAKRIGLDKVRLTVLQGDPVSKHIIQAHSGVWVQDFVCKKGETYHLFEIRLLHVSTEAPRKTGLRLQRLLRGALRPAARGTPACRWRGAP